MENYNHELEERYQQLRFLSINRTFYGRKETCRRYDVTTHDEEAFSLESLFSSFQPYTSKELTIKNGGIYKNYKHFTDVMLKPHHSYPCFDKSLKFTIRQYGTDEWNDVAYFMPYMNVDAAWRIIDGTTNESKDTNE